MAKDVTDALAEAGHGPCLGIFGVEFFVKGDDVWFSELSPRPHDTGMVTMVTQAQSEFELHARAILGLPVSTAQSTPGASAAASSQGQGGQGPGSQPVGVNDVGAPAQTTQPGHGQGVVEAGAWADLERLGASRFDVQRVKDCGGRLDNDVVAVGGQDPGAVGQVGPHPSGG